MTADLANIFLVFLAQLIYSCADLGQRVTALRYGYGWHLLTKPLFLLILLVPGIGLAIQIFVLSRYEVSKTITLLGVFAVTITPLLGVIFLKEKFSLTNWIGVVFAVVAIFLVSSRH
jgi:drug/metabolite transporter (DMT)-like permease